MSRGATRRSWVKLWVTGWLHGSIRWQLDAAERSTWADLICMAGECNQDGRICDNDGRALPIKYIANTLNIPIDLLGGTIAKCKAEGRIEDRNDSIIVIANWKAYQSEYLRQKPYRGEKKKLSNKTFKKCPQCHYLVEISNLTERMEICPRCMKKGKEVKLETKDAKSGSR